MSAMRIRSVTISAVSACLLALAASPGSASGGAEATDRWVEWHRRRALELRAEGRIGEALEEMLVVSNLRWNDPYAASEAAVLAIDAASAPGRTPTMLDPLVTLADRLVGEGVRRGGLHDPGLAYAIGRINMLKREYERAWRMLEECRRRGFDPVRADYWSIRAAINAATSMLDQGATDEVIQTLRAAADRSPDHPDREALLINLATAYRRRSDHVLGEAVVRDEILSRSPRNAKAWDVLAQIASELQRFDEAVAHARKAMELAKERDDGVYTGPAVYAEAVYHCAMYELARGRVDEARVLAEQYSRVRKDAADGLYLMGTILRTKGGPENLREAAILLRRACYKSPDDEQFLPRLVEVLHATGEDAEAQEWQAKLDAARARRAAPREPQRPDPGHR
ncbi:MAG: hypothetical protein HMLKMBBP_00701 [Planctomycetes bacterium]|nr:hypothetical protein [Planctomycetota bacterium]